MKRDPHLVFPVSVWYGANRARAPMVWPIRDSDLPRIREDLTTIKKAGFNAIRFWFDWLTAEKEPGEWHFEEIETLLSVADETDLSSIIQVYSDSAPNWVESEYPDSLFEDRSGLKIHSQASPGYCTDHPAVRSHVGEFYTRLAATAVKHTSLLGWDVWSEPHIVEWSWIDYMKDPWFCFCTHSQNRFREWLKRKYKAIENLNRSWYRTYRNWEEVLAPGYISLSSFRDVMDWISFNTEKIAEDLEWKANAIRKADPDHIVSSHAAISSVYGVPGVGYGASDDWKLAEKVDVWGTSLYPKHTGPWMPLKAHQICVALDASSSSCRSRGKPFWIGELQTGDGVTGMRFGAQVTASDVDRWAWQCVSRGATGLHYYAWYPMSCGYEVSGFGLCEPDGGVNARVISAGSVSKIIRQNKDLFLEAKPVDAEIGILYNVKAHGTLPGLRVQGAEILRKDMFGFYRAMMEQGYAVDFLHLDDLHHEILRRYKALFIPGSFVLNQTFADALKTYVYGGGTLIADFRPGWIDEEGNLSLKIPGMGLDEVFGCYEDYTIENRDKLTWCTDTFERIPAHEHITTFILTTGKAFGFFGKHPICVRNLYGKGYGIIIGTQIGCVIEENNREDVKQLLCSIVSDAGVNPFLPWINVDTGTKSGDVEVRMNTGNKGSLLFIFNYGMTPVTIDVQLKMSPVLCEKQVLDLKTGETLSLQENENGYGLRVNILPEDTRVLSIKTKKK